MFFKKEMDYILSLHPQYLGRRLQETIKRELYNEVEGKYFPTIGYVLMVLSTPSDAGVGLIDPNTGFAEFRIKYTALIYSPIVGEVTHAIATKITPFAIMCKYGPATDILVLRISFSFEYYLIFLINYNEKSAWKSVQEGTLIWKSEYYETPIQKDTVIKCRIQNVQFENDKMTVVASIEDTTLGPE